MNLFKIAAAAKQKDLENAEFEEIDGTNKYDDDKNQTNGVMEPFSIIIIVITDFLSISYVPNLHFLLGILFILCLIIFFIK